MTMHLVGPYLSMNSTKKRKTKGITARDRQAQADYKVYLRSLGVDPDKKQNKKEYTMFNDSVQSNYAEPRNTPYYNTNSHELPTPNKMFAKSNRSWKETQERLEISSQYSIMPAYNKGPYMVVGKSDIKTAGKKV